MAARKPVARKPRVVKVDLHAHGARVVSVFGPFNSRVLIEMPAEKAAEMFPDGALGAAGPLRVVDATEREIERIRKSAPDLADSAFAASAVAMAYEIEHPFNSATSKSMCAARHLEILDRLRELAPPEQKKDDLDDLRSRRVKRLGGKPAAAHRKRS